MKYQILNEDGTVANTIMADSDFVSTHYPGRYRLIEESPDTVPVDIPDVVTPFQAKAALLLGGFMPRVEALIDHPDTDALVKLAWTTALEFRRYSPSVLGIAQALGWTDAQLDQLFITAAGIEV